ncbi:germin-like protein subfamily 1 member 7 isoform X4 [Arachis duranensis]|uniref:Germin-like protein n=1 Tax=Arachis duranensis TaxID=130453 RepID=A0A9C6TN39_ARADU|nr:germin-like protein subfamily 1 member 7 isoform X4 [Arachis duranensis]
MKAIYFFVSLLALASSFASVYDPNPLQDFCVALNDTQNANPGNVVNKLGSNVTPVSVNELPGLNTLGISLARLDFAPKGLIPPHTHPRAIEIFTVVEGTLFVGFVTSNQNNTNHLFTIVRNKGDVFMFPIGLIHFQLNMGYGNVVAISSLSSQNPGVITVVNAVFGSTPPISPEVLTKVFQVHKKVINYLEKHI